MTYEVRKLTPEEHPNILQEIPEPPKHLWIAGNLPPPDFVLLTIVGSRHHTAYGREACAYLIEGLRGYPITIISGLALGIDTIAHQSALKANLPTIAVPGSGISERVIYPRTNARLASNIVEAGGCLLSEYEPDFTATTWSFPRRNRIMAGLAKATLVIESDMKSGTRITARLATDYNREVLAVPGSIFSPSSKGTNALLSLGATPITSPDDLLRALNIEPTDTSNPQEFLDLTTLSEIEQLLLRTLVEPKEKDELFRALNLSPSTGNVLLMRLEMNGYLTDAGNNTVRRVIS